MTSGAKNFKDPSQVYDLTSLLYQTIYSLNQDDRLFNIRVRWSELRAPVSCIKLHANLVSCVRNEEAIKVALQLL